jgi:hypothetical protein
VFDQSLRATNKQQEVVIGYFKKHTGGRIRPQQEEVLRVLIPNLLNAFRQGVNLECYMGNQYKANRTVKNKLVECKLIEYYRGSNFEDAGNKYTSKMMPLPLFYDLFDSLILVTTVDEKGKETKVRGEDPRIMDRLYAYNEFMKGHIVKDGFDNRLATNLHRCHKIYYGDAKEYKHRFHQSSYQLLSGKERGEITIDGESVVRIDIKGCHPRILYNLAKDEMKHNPYDAFPEHPEMVAVCKCAMMMIMNNGSRRSAIGAFNKEIQNNTVEFFDSIHCMKLNGIKAKDVFDRVETLNSKISAYFYNSSCHRVMNLEANILFKTMELLQQNESCPSIQIFDELVCPASFETEALETLEKVWKTALKFTPKVTIKRVKQVNSAPSAGHLKIYAA